MVNYSSTSSAKREGAGCMHISALPTVLCNKLLIAPTDVKLHVTTSRNKQYSTSNVTIACHFLHSKKARIVDDAKFCFSSEENILPRCSAAQYRHASESPSPKPLDSAKMQTVFEMQAIRSFLLSETFTTMAAVVTVVD